MLRARLGPLSARNPWVGPLAIAVGVFGAVALAGLLYVVYIWVSSARDLSPPALPFDSATWIAAISSDNSRYRRVVEHRVVTD